MIAPRNNLPLLEDQHGEVRALEAEWLLAALERAAVKAGFAEWWLADHVLSSVCSYLGGIYSKNVVGLSRLEEAVRRALHDIGYMEIARCFEADSPATHISLLRCAQGVVSTEPAAFYEAIFSRIELLHQRNVGRFHFYELKACVVHINNNTAGSSATPLRTSSLVDVLRDKITSLTWSSEMSCSIS